MKSKKGVNIQGIRYQIFFNGDKKLIHNFIRFVFLFFFMKPDAGDNLIKYILKKRCAYAVLHGKVD